MVFDCGVVVDIYMDWVYYYVKMFEEVVVVVVCVGIDVICDFGVNKMV